MKMLFEWLGANLIILAVMAASAACGMLAALPFWLMGDDWLRWAFLPVTAATIAGGIFSGRKILWLVDRVANRDYYRQRKAGK